MYVGKKATRVDAYDKVIGRTKYTDDLSSGAPNIPTISVIRAPMWPRCSTPPSQTAG